ncbi:MAG: hypothetical protein WCQ53_08065, partial [bacterium]
QGIKKLKQLVNEYRENTDTEYLKKLNLQIEELISSVEGQEDQLGSLDASTIYQARWIVYKNWLKDKESFFDETKFNSVLSAYVMTDLSVNVPSDKLASYALRIMRSNKENNGEYTDDDIAVAAQLFYSEIFKMENLRKKEIEERYESTSSALSLLVILLDNVDKLVFAGVDINSLVDISQRLYNSAVLIIPIDDVVRMDKKILLEGIDKCMSDIKMVITIRAR